MKTVPSVYTLVINSIYLSHSTQVAGHETHSVNYEVINDIFEKIDDKYTIEAKRYI